MQDVLKFDFCTMEIQEHHLVVTINNGVHLTPEHNTILINIVYTYYRSRPFVYITNRVNDYTVDYAIYNETSKINNLAGFAIATPDSTKRIKATLEKVFLSQPLEVFETLEDAIEWSKQILKL